MSLLLPENPILEGIISFLASRPHAWKSWKLECLRVFDSQSQCQSAQWLMEFTDALGSHRYWRRNERDLSPSLFIQEALRPDFLHPEGKEEIRIPKGWKVIASADSLNSEDLGNWALWEKRAFQEPEERRIYLEKQ
jgi:hypothetical protein